MHVGSLVHVPQPVVAHIRVAADFVVKCGEQGLASLALAGVVIAGWFGRIGRCRQHGGKTHSEDFAHFHCVDIYSKVTLVQNSS